MKLKFSGTRGNIKIRSTLHNMHSSLRVSYRGKSIIIDFGEDWLKLTDEIKCDAIVLTHGHPDHAWGIKNGSPCPVFATEVTWELIKDFPIGDPRIVEPGQTVHVSDLTLEAFPLIHSIRCPAVGYKISAGKSSIFYSPDVVAIEDRSAALRNVDLYIGDGATILRSLVRRSGDALVGHTPIRTQIGWCRKEGVPRAIFSHCGTQIVSSDDTEVQKQVRELGQEQNVVVEVAHDGMEISV